MNERFEPGLHAPTNMSQSALSRSTAIAETTVRKAANGVPHTSEGEDERVAAHFHEAALDWEKIYFRRSVWGIIHQQRLSRCLAEVEKLGLPTGARVLDVGCGAGLATLALAQSGYTVEAVDAASAMVELTHRRAAEAGVGQLVKTNLGEIYNLGFSNGVFPVVITIGVVPWLQAPDMALKELSRILQPNGHLIFTADNCSRLALLLDPLTSPALRPIKKMLKRVLGIKGKPEATGDGIRAHQHSIKEIDLLLTQAGLERVNSEDLGFGPFTLFYKKALPEWLGIKVHGLLQWLADLGFPVIRSVGAQFLIVAKKIETSSTASATR